MGDEGAAGGLLAEKKIVGELLFGDLLGSGSDVLEKGTDCCDVDSLAGFGNSGEAHVADHLLA